MALHHGLLIVEGPHDVEFAGRFLARFHGIKRIRYRAQVSPFWTPLIPTGFPAKDDDLLKRVPVPAFFQSAQRSVAIHDAGGLSRVPSDVDTDLALLLELPAALGIVIDADTQTASNRYAELCSLLSAVRPDLMLPQQPGEVIEDSMRFGAFVLPNNQDSGRLEDVLTECAAIAFPTLLSRSQALVADCRADASLSHQFRSHKEPDWQKATTSVIGNVLKPGRAIQTSIQDNDWITFNTLERVAALRHFERFLSQLLDLPLKPAG